MTQKNNLRFGVIGAGRQGGGQAAQRCRFASTGLHAHGICRDAALIPPGLPDRAHRDRRLVLVLGGRLLRCLHAGLPAGPDGRDAPHEPFRRSFAADLVPDGVHTGQVQGSKRPQDMAVSVAGRAHGLVFTAHVPARKQSVPPRPIAQRLQIGLGEKSAPNVEKIDTGLNGLRNFRGRVGDQVWKRRHQVVALLFIMQSIETQDRQISRRRYERGIQPENPIINLPGLLVAAEAWLVRTEEPLAARIRATWTSIDRSNTS